MAAALVSKNEAEARTVSRMMMKAVGLLIAALAVVSSPAFACGPAPVSHGLTIFNATAQPIQAVEISPPSQDDWGPNQLGQGQSIAPNASGTFPIATGCTQDVRVEFASAQPIEWHSFDVCTEPNIRAESATAVTPHSLNVTNATQKTIETVQISPPSDNDWGPDWLGSTEYIDAGKTRIFSITRGCVEDIRVTFTDETQREYRSYDTCRVDLRVEPTDTVT